MSLRKIQEFSRHIAPLCPQLSDLEMKRVVVNTLRSFCEETDVYRREIASFALTPGLSVYDVNGRLDFPDLRDTSGGDLMEVVRVIGMRNDEGMDMPETFFKDMDDRFRGRRWYRESADDPGEVDFGRPVLFVPLERSKFIVWPTPDSDVAVTQLRVSLRPVYRASQVAEDLFDDYYMTIVSGALRDLLLNARVPYYNPQLAADHDRQYRKGISEYKNKARRRFYRGQVGLRFSGGSVARGRRYH